MDKNIYLDVRDTDKIKIRKILFNKEVDDLVKDIIIEFPEKYGIKPISFMETGLINASPENIQYTEDSTDRTPKVQINFYGKLIEEVDD